MCGLYINCLKEGMNIVLSVNTVSNLRNGVGFIISMIFLGIGRFATSLS